MMPTQDRGLAGLRVLVVDDDDDIRGVALIVLRGSELVAQGATSAREAELVLESSEIDVVVTDMVMPGLTGRQFLSWLETTHPNIPVVAMSGVPEQLRATAARSNVRSTLDKPFTVSALLDAIAVAAR